MSNGLIPILYVIQAQAQLRPQMYSLCVRAAAQRVTPSFLLRCNPVFFFAIHTICHQTRKLELELELMEAHPVRLATKGSP